MMHKTPAKAADHIRKPPNNKRWAREDVLREARRRARSISVENTKQTQAMLAKLVKEAGWGDEEFLEALIQDIAEKGRLGR